MKDVVILGGGTAGWMVAAALARFYGGKDHRISLVEADSIGTIGVGESTIPSILNFIRMLDLNEDDVVRQVGATFKLGIRFAGWGKEIAPYFHPFSVFGQDIEGVPFHQLYLREALGGAVPTINAFAIGARAAEEGRFARPQSRAGDPILRQLTYAFHIDATLFARMLSTYAQTRGVQRVSGKVTFGTQNEQGDVTAIMLNDGRKIVGDLFIDCSGFRAELIGSLLKEPWVDWSHWLPCDRAIAQQSSPRLDLPPYTAAEAHGAGWCWRIPLQQRHGNGVVYSSAGLSDDAAETILHERIGAEAIGAPNRLRFTPGCRAQSWKSNVISIGLSSGFVEPLEATSIHLIQEAVVQLLRHFPNTGATAIGRRLFNVHMQRAYEEARDFVILHYKMNGRTDTVFWEECRRAAVPTSLEDRIAMFLANGRVITGASDIFRLPSWVAVLLGQGARPHSYDTIADSVSPVLSRRFMNMLIDRHGTAVASLPTHSDYIRALGQKSDLLLSKPGGR